MKMLVIEDEPRLADILCDWFTEKGFEVAVCHEGITGYESAVKGAFDVIISDVMLPGKDGFTLVKNLRNLKIKVPVIMLTARTGLQDKLQGFEAGAEDYLTKPFEIEELDARVRVLLRKCGNNMEKEAENKLVCQDFVLEEDTHLIRNEENNKNVKLSLKEYTLLKYFMQNYDQLLTKEQITVHIWGYDTDVTYNNEEVYISFLRKKMKFIGTKVKIVTVRGGGYRLKGEE